MSTLQTLTNGQENMSMEIDCMEVCDMKKVFTMGINSAINADDYKKFIDYYKDYIYSMFFSPPIGKGFSTRRLYEEHLVTQKQQANFSEILNCIKEAGIKLEICMNVPGLSDDQLLRAIEYMENVINPDEIVCIDSYYDKLKVVFDSARFIYSFNNVDPLRNLENVKKYDEVAVGKYFLYSKKSRDILFEMGVIPRLLVNNGCMITCPVCINSQMCKKNFQMCIEDIGVENAFVQWTMWPFEMHRLMKNDPRMTRIKYKLSTRTKSIEQQRVCIDSYIKNMDIGQYISEHNRGYTIWCGLAHFYDYYDSFDYLDILERKKSQSWNWFDEVDK